MSTIENSIEETNVQQKQQETEFIKKIESFSQKWEQVNEELSKNEKELKEKLEIKRKELDIVNANSNQNDTSSSITIQQFLKKNNKMKNEIRFDIYGNKIIKGKKKHKLAFDENVIIFTVENWKKYNFVEDEDEQKKCCNCKQL